MAPATNTPVRCTHAVQFAWCLQTHRPESHNPPPMTTGDGTPQIHVPPPPGGARVGLQLGRYELLHEIATGGMATVYLARARAVAGFERIVAIKVCHPHLRHEEEFSAMFLDEARLAASIHHPNVVSTLDVGEAEQLYLVMEYIEGDRISGLIKAASRRSERMPVPVTLRVMIDVLAGLHAAHELKDSKGAPLNIVHRDVSPQNILVGVDGVTRITDFGIAKAEARLTVTREGQVKGKMSYMAPEQLSSTNVNRRADVYAAGIVLWEALTGRRLFRAETEAETLNLVLHGVVPPPSSVVPELPAELDAVLRKALERDPDKRFQTAAEFADALENLESLKVATSRAVSTYINDLLSDQITKRRELVRKLSEHGVSLALSVDHSGVRAATELSNPFSQASTRTKVPPLPGAIPGDPNAPQTALEIDPEPAHRRTAIWAAGAVVLLLLVVAAVIALRAPTPPAPVAQPTPPPATLPSPEPVAQPVAQPLAQPVAQPLAQPVANDAAVAAAPVEDPPAPTPLDRPRRGGRAGRFVRPPRTNAGAGGGATVSAPPAGGGAQGNGEFRPSGI